ncbi:hypothetical protein V6N12_064452 [Hibiscus sabdariffa]|uniref:Uncharacterized protein n=1 Tax=Hibiscus sabdariffa TaxID=183260 RepID=A0ABR2G5U3_9ROSI
MGKDNIFNLTMLLLSSSSTDSRTHILASREKSTSIFYYNFERRKSVLFETSVPSRKAVTLSSAVVTMDADNNRFVFKSQLCSIKELWIDA